MELRDYVAALRRHWPVWVGVTVTGLVIALGVLVLAPRTYTATAQVFVSSSAGGANSPQFVAQRVKSYPDVAESAAVLEPAARALPGSPTVHELRAHVTASNPVDTSQIDIVATGDDPDDAAAIANAVADHFTDVVEKLEQPRGGESPVALTVTNPATAPSSPTSPNTVYVLAVGLLVGLFLGLAGAIVRSRLDPALHDADDVTDAWGVPELTVLSAPAHRRAARTGATPAAALTRRLELLAGPDARQVVVLSPAPGQQQAVDGLAAELTAELARRGLTGVRVATGDPQGPLRGWRALAADTDQAVLVLPRGRVLAAELREARTLLTDVGLPVLAAVVVPARAPEARTGSPARTAPAGTTPPQATPPSPRSPLTGTAPTR